jgi:Holliday junction resolvasome RuvABC endonuclease subunit
MNVIGLDLSLTSTGIALPGQEMNAISIETKKRGEERLVYIRNRILELVRAHNSNDDLLAIVEGYSFGSRNSHSHALGELGGVVKVALFEEGVPLAISPPTCRAKFATGRGNAGKSEVISSVSSRTGLVWKGKGADDCSDAWVLQEMGLTYLGHPRYSWPVENRKGLDNVDWSRWDVAIG